MRMGTGASFGPRFLGPAYDKIRSLLSTRGASSWLILRRDLFAKSWCPSGVQSVWLEGDTWVLVRLYRLPVLSRVGNGLSLTLVFTVICFGCCRRIRLIGPAATLLLFSIIY